MTVFGITCLALAALLYGVVVVMETAMLNAERRRNQYRPVDLQRAPGFWIRLVEFTRGGGR